MAREYSENEIITAKNLIKNLKGFTNAEISLINDGKPCTNDERGFTMVEILTEEFGSDIFKVKGINNLVWS